MRRTTGLLAVASRCTGSLGFLPWASTRAAFFAARLAGTEKSGRLSSMMRLMPLSISSRFRARSASPLAKKSGWRTSRA
ncbi:hypothetical protein D3C86_1920740 [compost metagenome]